MVSTGLIAIDATILATAVPSIVDDLGGFAEFPWLFSVYLLAQAVSVPIYAKLADTVGRKPILLLGIALFLAGSLLCGFAWSMPALIAFRVVQGLGAGAIQPIAITVVGDIYTVAERARVQGYLASVWAVSSVVGPTLGGVFSELGIWRWIFFVNVPVCVAAAWLLARSFHEDVERRPHRIDWSGGVLLTTGLTLVILATLEGGEAWAWDAWPSLAGYGLGTVLLLAFVLVERRAPEPVLPLWVFSRRLLLSTALVALGVGAVLIGLTSYVPTFLEGTLGVSPLTSGLALAAMTIGWPLAASLSGRFYLRIGFRSTVLVGCALAVLGAVLMAWLSGTPSVASVAASTFVVGLGLGLVAAPSTIAAQSSVGWGERGVVTGTNMFSRSIGSAVGVAVFGALANGVLARSGGGASDAGAVQDASTVVFVGVAVAAVGMTAAALLMPRTTPAAEPR
nr:MDR family MFS transporter [Cellulomonas sp. PhB143]